MVFKKSEYQNQFKSSLFAKNQSIYEENLTFRHERRDREFIHTPINWFSQGVDEGLSSEEENNENSNCNIISKAGSKKNDEPQYQSLAEILDASKAKTIAFRQQRRVEDDRSKDLPDVLTLGRMSLDDGRDSTLKTKDVSDPHYGDDKIGELNDSSCKLLKKKDESSENPSTINGKELYSEKQLKSKSNIRKKASSKKKCSEHVQSSHHRPQSAQGLRDDCCYPAEPNGYQIPSLPISTKPRRPDRQRRAPSTKCRPVSQERPPFVAYGAGDREDTFTTHRTHNVRSTVDVYGAALKAKIRREEEKKRQLQRHKRLAQSASDILEKLASATPRDMIDYRSEYQKQFHGYEPREYERSSSSRAVIPHSAPIRAVHRGDSLIVHVD